MTDAFARGRDVVTRVATAWDDLVPRLAGARARIVGLPKGAEAQTLHDRLDALSDALIADPLSVPAGDVAALEADLDSIARSEHEHDELRRVVLSRIRDALQPARSLRASGHRLRAASGTPPAPRSPSPSSCHRPPSKHRWRTR